MFIESRTSRTELTAVHRISLKSKENDRCGGSLSFSYYAAGAWGLSYAFAEKKRSLACRKRSS